MEIKEMVKELQKEYTLTEIAAELGTCVPTLYAWTGGHRKPKKVYVEKLMNMLKKKGS